MNCLTGRRSESPALLIPPASTMPRSTRSADNSAGVSSRVCFTTSMMSFTGSDNAWRISSEVIDVRSLVPLDTRTILGSVARTNRLFTVEENPRLCGWGAEVASIAADEAFYDLDGPIVRITTPHIPLPAADNLEDLALPTPERIADTVRRAMG